ncbi:hypothetical protein Tco_1348703 [Tanacetum coccineum]
MNVFFRTTLHHSTDDDGVLYLGELYFSMVILLFNGFTEFPMKGLQRQKEAKTIKNRQGTEETRTRVKNQPKIKPDQPDTAGKTVKGRNKKERTISDKLSKFEGLFEVLEFQGLKL